MLEKSDFSAVSSFVSSANVTLTGFFNKREIIKKM